MGAQGELAIRTMRISPAPASETRTPTGQMRRERLVLLPNEEALIRDEATITRRRLCDPYVGIKGIVDETPRVIPLEEILIAYEAHSKQNGNSVEEIKKGKQLIASAYHFAEEAFEGKLRKDRKTPAFSHSTRLGAMIAHLGAEAWLIAATLLHDTIEDCDKGLRELNRRFGQKIGLTVALLTKPMLLNPNHNGNGLFRRASRTVFRTFWQEVPLEPGMSAWVHLASNQWWWEKIRMEKRDAFTEDRRKERMEGQIGHFLNIRAEGITAEMKLGAHVVKNCDMVDSIVTDRYIDPVIAEIRLRVFVAQLPLLDISAPQVSRIARRVLKDRGYPIPEIRVEEMREGDDVLVKLAPPELNFSADYLERYRAPRDCFIVYSDDTDIHGLLYGGRFENKIRIELPHIAPLNSAQLLQAFFRAEGLRSLTFEPGKSLLPAASYGAGRIILVDGIRDMQTYTRFETILREFHPALNRLLDGTGRMP